MSSGVFWRRSFSRRNWIPCLKKRKEDTDTSVTYFRDKKRGLMKLCNNVSDSDNQLGAGPTFLGSMLNFFLPMAICLFLWVVLLQ